jgi:hypothetical protein
MTHASPRRRWSAALAGASGALLLALPGTAAPPSLYHSPGDTGVDPGALVPALPNTGPRTVFLYLNPGPTATSNGGEVCDVGPGELGGDGDETCGEQFRLVVTGGLSIVSFTPAPGVGGIRSMSTGTAFSAAIVTPVDPIAVGPQRIGTLAISGANGSAQLELLETVDASLDLQTGAPRQLFFVPEPDGRLLVLAGVAGLAGLARLRGALGRRR